MGGFEHLKTLTLPIGGAIAQGIFVTINSSGQAVAAAAGANAVGVTLEAVTAAQYDSGNGQVTVPVAAITAGGRCRIKAGSAAIAVGASVSSGASGVAVTTAAGAAVLGTAEEASENAKTELITVFLDKQSANDSVAVVAVQEFPVDTGTSRFVVSPIAGNISRIRAVVTTVLAGAAEPAGISLEIATVAVVGGTLTIPAEAAAGSGHDSGAIAAVATTLVAAGDVIEIISDGIPTSGDATISVEITPL